MDQSWLTGTYMYNQAFIRGDVDYSSAIAVVIVVLGVVFAQVANKVFKQKDY
jgi:raffinose/stachyose/melibiose transport system permease protein